MKGKRIYWARSPDAWQGLSDPYRVEGALPVAAVMISGQWAYTDTPLVAYLELHEVIAGGG